MQQWGKLVVERTAVEAQLAVLHHRNTTLEEERVVTINHEGGGSTLASPGPAKMWPQWPCS
jgi:hypothetical protein